MPSSRVSHDEPAETPGEFEQIFERYYRPGSFYFGRRGCTREECQDLTQETFLGVYKGMERYREEANIETWLFIIAANIWRNWLRSRSALKRNAPELSLEQSVESGKAPASTTEEAHPLDRLLTGERWDLLRRGLDELPPRMRYCLLLRLDQGLKYREIATIMNISVQTVKSQLHQARERLKTMLSEHFTDP